MTEAEATAQSQIQAVVEDLKRLELLLLGIDAALPPSPQEAAPQGEAKCEDPDITTELRAVIRCVLKDSLRPAARDFAAVARYRQGRAGG
jgi:hypothetical protein